MQTVQPLIDQFGNINLHMEEDLVIPLSGGVGLGDRRHCLHWHHDHPEPYIGLWRWFCGHHGHVCCCDCHSGTGVWLDLDRRIVFDGC